MARQFTVLPEVETPEFMQQKLTELLEKMRSKLSPDDLKKFTERFNEYAQATGRSTIHHSSKKR